MLRIVLFLIAGFVAVVWWQRKRFAAMVAQEADDLIHTAQAYSPGRYDPAQIADLPDPVQRYFKRNLTPGQPLYRFVRFRQQGTLSTSPNAKAMPFDAVEYLSAQPPAFLWQVRLKMPANLWIDGRDKYQAGHGAMLIKPLSAVAVVDAHDADIAEASALRWLAEAFTLPTALLPSAKISWSAAEEPNQARIGLHDAHIDIQGTVTFNDAGDIVAFRAMRVKDSGQPPMLWGGDVSGHQQFNNMWIPTQVSVKWFLPEGDYTYFDATWTDYEFDVFERYG